MLCPKCRYALVSGVWKLTRKQRDFAGNEWLESWHEALCAACGFSAHARRIVIRGETVSGTKRSDDTRSARYIVSVELVKSGSIDANDSLLQARG